MRTATVASDVDQDVRAGGHRMRRRRRGREIIMYVVVGALAASGAAFATRGLWRDSVQFDRLSWLGKDGGQITGLDPKTGQPKGQLQIGGPGDVMTVAQGDNVLIVTNTRTGEVTAVSLPGLDAHPVGSGDPDKLKVLLAGDQIYLADLPAGAVQRIDALTATAVGQPWHVGGRLIDAAADNARVWALAEGGQLVALQWSEPDGRLREERRATVDTRGPRTVLVAHAAGVTAFDPDGPKAVRFGTNNDGTVTSSSRATALLAADSSPDDLVPFSAPDESTVLMVRDGDVVAVDSAQLGCRRPGRPVVYRGKVYAACRGDGKVIVLDPSGQSSGEVATPAREDAVLVLARGRLFVNVPNSDAAVMVSPDGSTRTIDTEAPEVRARDARPKPSARPGRDNRAQRGPGAPARQGAQRTTPAPAGGAGDTDGAGDTGGAGDAPPPGVAAPGAGDPGPETTTAAPPAAAPPPPPPPPPDYRPTNVSAVALSTGSVRVTWTSGGGPVTGYQVVHSGTGAVLASPAATATSATISGLAQGQAVAFYVKALTGSGDFTSAVSSTVYPYREPPEPPRCRGCDIP
jgi:Fibronectin type III domain